ncbi:hypothetical protein CYLTODRAFT_412505 [Cylindrobasidium torrendii FP15055 ss-10]|uniref:Uncharacterized protein n=1 Tax=Cylindrobasidium torrendii FP15055 ss-10 TaxID=1314674 RepID=A0A0D7B5R9_9AGAR|nr:hypothetical protein CYLTODRAFT_412505 [Cylindrobasidium torrendii FP15055 ss-10]
MTFPITAPGDSFDYSWFDAQPLDFDQADASKPHLGGHFESVPHISAQNQNWYLPTPLDSHAQAIPGAPWMTSTQEKRQAETTSNTSNGDWRVLQQPQQWNQPVPSVQVPHTVPATPRLHSAQKGQYNADDFPDNGHGSWNVHQQQQRQPQQPQQQRLQQQQPPTPLHSHAIPETPRLASAQKMKDTGNEIFYVPDGNLQVYQEQQRRQQQQQQQQQSRLAPSQVPHVGIPEFPRLTSAQKGKGKADDIYGGVYGDRQVQQLQQQQRNRPTPSPQVSHTVPATPQLNSAQKGKYKTDGIPDSAHGGRNVSQQQQRQQQHQQQGQQPTRNRPTPSHSHAIPEAPRLTSAQKGKSRADSISDNAYVDRQVQQLQQQQRNGSTPSHSHAIPEVPRLTSVQKGKRKATETSDNAYDDPRIHQQQQQHKRQRTSAPQPIVPTPATRIPGPVSVLPPVRQGLLTPDDWKDCRAREKEIKALLAWRKKYAAMSPQERNLRWKEGRVPLPGGREAWQKYLTQIGNNCWKCKLPFGKDAPRVEPEWLRNLDELKPATARLLKSLKEGLLH